MIVNPAAAPESLRLSFREKALLIKALAMAASRLEAYGRTYPRTAKRHDVAAREMRELRQRLHSVQPIEVAS